MEMQIQNWGHDFQKSFRDLRELYAFLGWGWQENLYAVAAKFPIFIPRTLAEKMRVQGPTGVLAREFLPDLLELDQDLNRHGFEDPIGDKAFKVAPQLIHRYPSRVLFTATNICPVHCRYCFRKNELNAQDDLFQKSFEQTFFYLENHKEVSEIIFTGGDPLTLSNDVLDKTLLSFAKIKHIKDIRFHSRYPVIMPSRLDEGFHQIIKKYAEHFRTISLAIHANHVDEFDQIANEKIKNLSQLPLQLLSQTVLLSGVNDSTESLVDLYQHFIELRVRPYYLHHPDRVSGGMHFYLPLSRGRKIVSSLRKKLPGWAQPNYVLDVPGGEGKVSVFNPEAFEYSGKIINLNSEILDLPEPDLFR
jgi:lysine 2,3-aminomutase